MTSEPKVGKEVFVNAVEEVGINEMLDWLKLHGLGNGLKDDAHI